MWQADACGIDLGAIFSAQGPLARSVPQYHVRAAQIEMAQAVSHAIENNQTTVLEAGTGIGKTAAYLVPALLHGGKVIVSTGTKTLQDQLFNRDLPNIQQALALPVKAALLKGRSNYLCWHYHHLTNQDATLLTSQQEVRDLAQINRFIAITPSGDKAQCVAVPEHASVWSRVTSTRDNCLGTECADHHRCFVVKARREAQDADIVVVNHHLFFADLMLREDGIQELLPKAQTLIFDEAHQLADTATLFFGRVTSSAQLLDLIRDTKVIGLTMARDACDWLSLTAPIEIAVKNLRLIFQDGPSKWSQSQLPEHHAIWPALRMLCDELAQLNSSINNILKLAETAATAWLHAVKDLTALARRGDELLKALLYWCQVDRQNEPELLWLDINRSGWQLHVTPVSVADVFKRQRLEHTSSAWEEDEPTLSAPPEQLNKAWIFTSATLAVKEDFSLFQESLGLQDAKCKSWPSPYNYFEQAILYVPKNIPNPQFSGYASALVEAALPLIVANEGRTFFLCTSLRSVEQISIFLRQEILAQGLGLQVLTQGDAPRATLLDEFRRIKNAVLVGSHSFWEGVDVKGDALSLVIIDKLPFAPPDEPVLAKRLDLLAQQGGNPFMEYQVPQAIIALKQGAGRLIRSENDRGVLMIGDTRLIDKPYGRRIWQSLPPMRRSREQQEVLAFLEQIKPITF